MGCANFERTAAIVLAVLAHLQSVNQLLQTSNCDVDECTLRIMEYRLFKPTIGRFAGTEIVIHKSHHQSVSVFLLHEAFLTL